MTDRMFDLTGRVAWVAGGAGYLGSAICRALACHGATVVICDQAFDRAQSLAQAIASQGQAAAAMELDVADEQAVAGCADAIVHEHGRLDIAINATFAAAGKSMDQLTMADWEKTMRVGLGSAFAISREAARHMKTTGGGSIIQFSSMYGLVSPDPANYSQDVSPGLAVNPIEYGVSKAGIVQMVRYLAVMWGRQNIRVNAIAPGPFPNPDGMGANEAFTAKLAGRTPLGRVGQAREIAGTAMWLASGASSYVTGACIPVDGGWTAW